MFSTVSLTEAGQESAGYDLVLKNGHVIDPHNDRDRPLDIAVKGDRIVRVALDIPAEQARKSVDLRGLYVTPGLIDLHRHIYDNRPTSLFPDETSLTTGTTTIVECGGTGWRNFDDFKTRFVDRARTRLLAFINIVGHGNGGNENDLEDMDPIATAGKVGEYPELIVGIKNSHFGRPGWASVERALEAGRLSERPVILDNSILSWTGRSTREKVLELMRPGDVHTHLYNDRQLELLNRSNRRVQPYMLEARRRGVIFDLGHGSGSFLWPVAAAAMAQGFPPDTLSSDLHRSSILATESDLPNCISKMLLLGMDLQEAVYRTTVRPAQVIGRFPELGTLTEGKVADIAVFELEQGVFAFHDAWGMKRLGNDRLTNVMTLRAGEIVHDRNGLSFPEWQTAGDYEQIQ